MNKKIFALFLTLLMLLALVGCDNTQNLSSGEATNETPNPLVSDTFAGSLFFDLEETDAPINGDKIAEIIPKIPSDKYEAYPKTHRAPVSATLYKDGEAISIAADDPRLIQLTNFFNNCVYYSKCGYTQGLYSAEDVEEILSAEFRLELTYEPYGAHASPYGDETTGSDTFVVTTSFTAIDHSSSGYNEEGYYVVGFLPLWCEYNLLELFGF